MTNVLSVRLIMTALLVNMAVGAAQAENTMAYTSAAESLQAAQVKQLTERYTQLLENQNKLESYNEIMASAEPEGKYWKVYADQAALVTKFGVVLTPVTGGGKWVLASLPEVARTEWVKAARRPLNVVFYFVALPALVGGTAASAHTYHQFYLSDSKYNAALRNKDAIAGIMAADKEAFLQMGKGLGMTVSANIMSFEGQAPTTLFMPGAQVPAVLPSFDLSKLK